MIGLRSHVFAVMFLFLAAGCLSGEGTRPLSAPSNSGIGGTLGEEALNDARPMSDFRVVDRDGEPVPYAGVAAFADDPDRPLAILSADKTGLVAAQRVPAAAHGLQVGSSGYVARTVGVSQVPPLVVLEAANQTPSSPVSFLELADPVALACPDDPLGEVQGQLRSCSNWAETVVEVGSDGAIWASTTCCPARPPPIWVSRDNGTRFELLRDPLREVLGIEGDFAVDEEGNVFFADMHSYGGGWLTSYTANGDHRWTFPFTYHLMDRPFVRAGRADEVFVVYNTAVSTAFLASADGGRTWDAARIREFPCPLGMLGQGPSHDRLFVVACTEAPKIWVSSDSGASWSGPEAIPLPQVPADVASQRANSHDHFVRPPVADEAGTIYVVYKDPLNAREQGIFVNRRSPAGSWSAPVLISQSFGQNWMPWGAAGKAGSLGLAWYHADEPAGSSNATWHLMAAASVDADAEDPHFQLAIADPTPVFEGGGDHIFGSSAFSFDAQGAQVLKPTLGDFLQSDLTPDGRLAIGYARLAGGSTQAYVLLGRPGLDLSGGFFANGRSA